jgi:NAD(P) transhydrogenase subunit alpha
MKIGVPKETAAGERRVALVPDVVKSLQAKVSEKIEPVVESGAGAGAGHPDASYEEAGAAVADGGAAWGAEVVLHVRPPAAESNRALAEAGVTAFAMEAIPRTTRAQAMDALSSQANLAGYAATLLAAREAGQLFPMMTTAAGTVAPA